MMRVDAFCPTFCWAAANGGVTNGGLRGVWPPWLDIGRNRPFSPLFLPFSSFSGGCEEHLENPENGGKRPFSSDILRFAQPPSLKPPFAAPQFWEKSSVGDWDLSGPKSHNWSQSQAISALTESNRQNPTERRGFGFRNRSPKSQIASDFPSHP